MIAGVCGPVILFSLFVWQSWDVFQDITEILILVPAVLGMKGNLEMTLASRLSTVVSLSDANVFSVYYVLFMSFFISRQYCRIFFSHDFWCY